MGKILIVEDEYIERMELNKQMACEFGAKNIFTASTCAQAINLIKNETPDIVMLDIMLKNNSGFEVANFIKQRYPKVQIIIITAYSEFDFAYTAMNMGITNYLLKPVRPEIILEKIKKMMYNLPKVLDQNIIIWPYLEKGLTEPLRDILPFYPNVIGVASAPKDLNSEKKVQLMDLLRQKTNSIGWIEKKDDLIIIYLKLEDSHSIQYFFNNLYDACFKIGIGHIKFGVDKCIASFEKVSEAYSGAIYAYRSTIFFQSYNVIYADTYQNTKIQPGKYPFDIEKYLVVNISKGVFTPCIDNLQTFVDYCLKNCGNDYHVLENWVNNLKYAINRYCTQQGILLDVMNFIVNLSSREDLYNSLSEIVRIITDDNHSTTTVRNPIIIKALNIIITRPSENLSLNMIAKELYINPIYLSRLFKQQAGYNFKKYLIKVRFSTARTMLLDETKSIAEIAQHCGYSNPNYFSKAFRDCYGQTPTEFRQQLAEKNI